MDIHNFARQYACAQALVTRSSLNDRNKAFLLAYRDACLARQVCGTVRLTRALPALVRVGIMLGKEFDQVTREDLQGLVTCLMNNGLSPASIATYKAIIKRFFSFVLRPDEFPNITTMPPAIAWITVHVRRRDVRRVQRRDLLDLTDVQALVRASCNPRDKALVALLWETGCRISELGNLQVKHITRTADGYTLDVVGKTGQRTPLVIGSAPYLRLWLALHPFKDNPESPLWVQHYPSSPRLVHYAGLRLLLMRLFERAGIDKPFHPHIFRHSRVTYLLATGTMNESQCERYLGWAPESDMLATYSHLTDQDANEAIKREHASVEHEDDLLRLLTLLMRKLRDDASCHAPMMLTRCDQR